MQWSAAEENHIKHIYSLQTNDGLVSTNSLAEVLATKPASVTDMLKKLKAKGVITYQAYKGFALTETGKKLALQLIRKHRLWEFFLYHNLGFSWDEVHDIAEQLEHINSELLIDKLEDYLGNPSMDPHGDLIPNKQGKLPKVVRVALPTINPLKTVVVCGVTNQSAQMLQILNHYKIAIGAKIKVVKHFIFDNSIQVKINNQGTTILSPAVAQNILVYE
jgi:DtxR family transcriptional regulator, Mn-dependent transcriptional regulator